MYAFIILLLVVVLLYARRCTENYNPGEDVINGEPKLDGTFAYYPGTYGFSVKPGGASSAKICYGWAKRNGLNHWGWRKNDKSCFSYADPSVLTLMRYRDSRQNETNVKIGCTKPGVSVVNGCMDWSNRDFVWGKLDDDRLKLFDPEIAGSYLRVGTMDECRKAASKKEYDAFVYATNRHPDQPATCYGVYKNSLDLYDFLGGKIGSDLIDDYRYITACTDPTKKVVTGCK